MQHDFSSVPAYLDSLPDDWRGALVRTLHAELEARGLVAGIGYKMLSYSDDAGTALHLNAQAKHVGLYPGMLDVIDPEGTILAGFDCGKGCVRLKKRDSQAMDRVGAVIDRVLALRADGIATDC